MSGEEISFDFDGRDHLERRPQGQKAEIAMPSRVAAGIRMADNRSEPHEDSLRTALEHMHSFSRRVKASKRLSSLCQQSE